MSYIGQPFNGPSTGAVQHESGNGSTTAYTLDFAVGSSESVATYLDGVRQVPGSGKDYTAAGVTLTFSTAVPSGVSILIQYLALPIALPEPGNDTVTGAKIVDNAVDSEHYTDGSIDLAHMSSQSVDEDNLHISNSGSNGQFLSKQSGNAGGLTWAGSATSTKFLSASFNMTTSSGTVDVTGADFDPTIVYNINCSIANTHATGWGMANSGGQGGIYSVGVSSAPLFNSIGSRVFDIYTTNTSTYQLFALSFITDGIRLTHSKGGSPSGTLVISMLVGK